MRSRIQKYLSDNHRFQSFTEQVVLVFRDELNDQYEKDHHETRDERPEIGFDNKPV